MLARHRLHRPVSYQGRAYDGQARSARNVSTRSILSHSFMFACGVAVPPPANPTTSRGVASALEWGRYDVWGLLFLDSSLMASLAMMLGFGRASGKAVHSPINPVSSFEVHGSSVRKTRHKVAMRQLVGQMTIRRRESEVAPDEVLRIASEHESRSRFTPAFEELVLVACCSQPCSHEVAARHVCGLSRFQPAYSYTEATTCLVQSSLAVGKTMMLLPAYQCKTVVRWKFCTSLTKHE